MRENCKYVNQYQIAYRLLFQGIMFWILILVWSCKNRDEHTHIPTNKTDELSGLQQPTNRIVFSDVKTIVPRRQLYAPVVKATGIISYDPRLLNTISARFSGRIEKLYVRFNFEKVSKGQRIMDVYSPEILTAQEDLILLLTSSPNDTSIINSSKQKLRLLGLTNEQLLQIEKTKKPINPLPLYSPYSGHIHDIGINNIDDDNENMNIGMNSDMNGSSSSADKIQVNNLPSSQSSSLTTIEGMYLQKGQAVFAVYNTNNVWAVLDIFPADASLIKVGDKVTITAETNPDNIISSHISYIEPVAGQNASSLKARVYLQNSVRLNLKIGTLISAKIETNEIDGMWLPRNAVVNLGQNQVVFLKIENYFVTKFIQTGISNDSMVQIITGLEGTEQVAVNAQFLVDSESFIKTTDDEKK